MPIDVIAYKPRADDREPADTCVCGLVLLKGAPCVTSGRVTHGFLICYREPAP